MLKNPNTVLEKLFYFGVFNIGQNKIDNIIEKNSFSKIRGRECGVNDDTKYVRKGIFSEWKTIFFKEQKLLFNKFGEDVVTKLGYQSTLSNE